MSRVNKLFIGQCTDEFGYIIDISKYHFDEEDLEGVVQDTTGETIFNVRFDVVAFKPNINEILDGRVYSVNDNNIEVYSGPVKSYIDKSRLGGDYQYNSTQDQFSSTNPDFKPIKRNSVLRYRIENLKFQNNEFIAISTIQDNFLGVITS